MKFSAVAALAVAAGVQAATNATATVMDISYTTEVVTALTTYCPAATQITHGGSTYTITSATTLTITDCPCTVTRPITTISSVSCNSCYANSTSTTAGVKTTPVPTTSTSTSTSKPSSTVTVAGAGKAAALSGGALAGVFAVAAFIL